MPVTLWNNKVLINDGRIAMDQNCCCPPTECPCDTDAWEQLVLSDTSCGGFVSCYRIKDYNDGDLLACSACAASVNAAWDGTFPIHPTTRCRWSVFDAPDNSINSKILRLAALRYSSNPVPHWEVRVDCDTDPGGDIIFEGEKATGTTPVGPYLRVDTDCPSGQPTSLYIEECP